MKCIALWYGGRGYASPDPSDPKDLEQFDSLKSAVRVFESRADYDPYYPCVEEDTEMHVYFNEYSENGPDRILTIGPRGGVRITKG